MVRQLGLVPPISIHALREEGDMHANKYKASLSNFYPRPPRGGRRAAQAGAGLVLPISIHALREEGDLSMHSMLPICGQFLSTPSARRATFFACKNLSFGADFYPRPPRGGRPAAVRMLWSCAEFLSTPSARRATLRRFCQPLRITISIHALREEGDFLRCVCHIDIQAISIHALREEGDRAFCVLHNSARLFLSTPSARRATPLA